MSAPSFHLCLRVYDRARMRGATYANLACQYRVGHDGGCSWSEVAEDDKREVLAAQAAEQQATLGIGDGLAARDATESMVSDFCEAIEAGELDEWLEFILSVGHDRKRARRGTRGFGRRRG